MPVPIECNMPDLADLTPLMGRLLIKFLVREPNLSHRLKLYRRIYIRLLDKAVREYQSARAMVNAQIAERQLPVEEMYRDGRLIYMITFVDYMENCINATRRLCAIIERIKGESIYQSQHRDARRQIESLDDSIRGIRNLVEHMDEQIMKDQVAPEQPIMLIINENGDRLNILNIEIKCVDLANVLRRIHQIGEYLLQPSI